MSYVLYITNKMEQSPPMLISSIAIGIALYATCHYWKEALDKSIDAYTTNHAVSIYAHNSKDIASKALFLITRHIL